MNYEWKCWFMWPIIFLNKWKIFNVSISLPLWLFLLINVEKWAQWSICFSGPLGTLRLLPTPQPGGELEREINMGVCFSPQPGIQGLDPRIKVDLLLIWGLAFSPPAATWTRIGERGWEGPGSAREQRKQGAWQWGLHRHRGAGDGGTQPLTRLQKRVLRIDRLHVLDFDNPEDTILGLGISESECQVAQAGPWLAVKLRIDLHNLGCLSLLVNLLRVCHFYSSFQKLPL